MNDNSINDGEARRLSALESNRQPPDEIEKKGEASFGTRYGYDARSLLENVFTYIPALIAFLDTEYKFIWVNQAYAQADGRSREFFVGKQYFELYPNAENQKIFQEVVETGIPYRTYEKPFTYPNAKKRGTTFWDWTLQPIKSKRGEVTGIILSLVDVTGRKRAEDQLLQMATVINRAMEGVGILNRNGEIQYVNSGFEEITGRRQDEIKGHPFSVLKAQMGDERLWQQCQTAIKHGEFFFGRLLDYKSNGRRNEAELHITPVRSRHNPAKVDDFVVILRDITNRIDLERQLEQTYKMEALGRMAGGIAHDLNNILMPIIVNIELLLEDLAPDNLERQFAEKALSAAERGRDLVRQVIRFSRKRKQPFEPLDIIPIIQESVEFIRSSIPSTVKIQLDIETSQNVIETSKVQMSQLLMNLCSNAADAMSNNGVICVSLKNIEYTTENKKKPGNLSRGEYVLIQVSDTGIGMNDEVRSRIFEPFYTTKSADRGTGMGLSIVHRIVRNHNGSIQVDSAPGVGTTFSIYLPCSSKQYTAESKKRTFPKDKGATQKCIMLVDDDVEVVTAAESALNRHGYRTIAFTDSVDALKAMRTAKVDLIVTDQSMPDITGVELIEKIRNADAKIPAIICTGYADELDKDRLQELHISELLEKPVGVRMLCKAVQRALEKMP